MAWHAILHKFEIFTEPLLALANPVMDLNHTHSPRETTPELLIFLFLMFLRSASGIEFFTRIAMDDGHQ